MKINNKEVSVDDAIKYANNKIFLLKHRTNSFLLSDYQVDVLNRNGINFNNYGSMNELLFDIEEVLNNDYDDELDVVSSQLAELTYYKDTKK